MMDYTFIYNEYSYCHDCKCWHSSYDKCADVQKDRVNKLKRNT